MATSIRMSIGEDRDSIALLGRLEIGLRGTYASKARKAAGNIAARRARALCPKPGYPGDRPGLKPLAETIRVIDREGQQLTVIGPEYPAGAHGHLVEFGHEAVLWGVRTGGRIPPHPFLRPAVDETRSEQQQVMADTLIAAVEEECGR